MKSRSFQTLRWLLLVSLAPLALAQVRHEIEFPDLPGYRTLLCDLHTHTVFSDGTVWPTVRVDEAWRLGLDVLSITDHIEYKPFGNDVSTDHNRPYELAIGRAGERNLLLPRGAEITRDTPPGHFNAVFLDDVNPLDTEDFLDAIEAANQQGAFVFWNHHAWRGEELGGWLDIHTELYDRKWLHGMEIANGPNYYPQAHQWCLDKGLTMVGTSDIHQPDLAESMTSSRHRTLTLVFAERRTLESVREALMAGRTAVWYQDRLIGRREYLEPLFHASVQVATPHLRTDDAVWFAVKNTCAMDIQLERVGELGPAAATLPARTTTLVRIATDRPNDPLELNYRAGNFWIAPETGLPVTLTVPGEGGIPEVDG